MLFTRIGTVFAYLGLVLGSIRIALGFILASGTETMESNVAVARRYLAASNTGEAINEGIALIVIAVALGILCEISKNQKTDAS